MPVLFKQVKIGAFFELNGNKCLKRSAKTATLIEYRRIFYVGANETCYL